MPDHMPEDMPDRMSNRMSEDMSDRMPEDLPVRKCINVMVGITRSKAIFLRCSLLRSASDIEFNMYWFDGFKHLRLPAHNNTHWGAPKKGLRRKTSTVMFRTGRNSRSRGPQILVRSWGLNLFVE